MIYLPTVQGINIYALCMLFFLYIMSSRYGDLLLQQRKVYRSMVAAAMLLLASDALNSILMGDGLLSSKKVLCFSAYMMYAPILWFAFQYFHYNIFAARSEGKGWKQMIGGLCLLDSVMALLTPWTGWLYFWDELGKYHRGPLFDTHLLLLSLGILLLGGMALYFRRGMAVSRFYSLLLFLVPPVVAVGLMLFMGVNLVSAGIAFSLLIIFVTLQSRDLVTDYLTGSYNRRRLEWILQERIRNAASQGFAAIMVDIDSFKGINDAYGHDAGDDALRNTADILRRCVRLKDIVARYGGDEFCVVISECREIEELIGIVQRIDAELRYFNEFSAKPYRLCLSMGYGLYDPASGMDAQSFQKHIDALMYQQKKFRHLQSVEGRQED